jgi:hypothetical protein
MDVVAGLQECLGSMLASFERSVGFAEGVVMSFDPDVLLPNGFAATVARSLDDALLACRNEQLDHDFLKFRDLAASRTRVGVASRARRPVNGWTCSTRRPTRASPALCWRAWPCAPAAREISRCGSGRRTGAGSGPAPSGSPRRPGDHRV